MSLICHQRSLRVSHLAETVPLLPFSQFNQNLFAQLFKFEDFVDILLFFSLNAVNKHNSIFAKIRELIN